MIQVPTSFSAPARPGVHIISIGAYVGNLGITTSFSLKTVLT